MFFLVSFTILFRICVLGQEGHQKQELRIAWLAPRESFRGITAESSVNVLKYGLRSAEYHFLKHHYIRVKWYDTKCTPKGSIAAAVDARNEFDPHVILGPPCSSAQTMNFVTTLFKWNRFAMLYDVDEVYKSVHEAISLFVKNERKTIASVHELSTTMSDEEIEDIFIQVRKTARILVLSVPWMDMRKYMLVAHRMNMTEGDFVFICINSDIYNQIVLDRDVLSDRVWRRNDLDDDEAFIAFESVIHIFMVANNVEVYSSFVDFVNKAGNISSPYWDIPVGSKSFDAYAPFIYDATTLWASVVNQTMAEGGDPRNGTRICELTRRRSNIGITGKLVINDNYDRLANIRFLDMKPDGKFAEFLIVTNHLNGALLESSESVNVVRWRNRPNGTAHAPPDTPKCGFENELCPKAPEAAIAAPDYTDSIIGAAVGSSFVFIIAVVVQVSLRHYRRRQQLESMIWQVKFDEIDFVTALLSGSVRSSFRNLARRRASSSKKVNKQRSIVNAMNTISDHDIVPGFHHLFENGAVMFGSVAYLRGSLVSVKRVNQESISLTKDLLQQLNKLMELKHQNITAFVGACVDPGRILLLWEYCPKGSLQDIIWNQNIKLDQMFKFAICQDVVKGLEYIHKSAVGYHGNLKSSNCVVDSRWTCKLTDFGVPKLRAVIKSLSTEENLEREFWTAPEVLRCEKDLDVQKSDIYSIGIIFKEVFTRSTAYVEYSFMTSNEIIERVKRPKDTIFRPLISREIKQNEELVQLITDCWSEDPTSRPTATRLVKLLSRLNPSKHMTMIDNMLAMLEKYANHLEELVAERTSELDAEKRKTENLLYRMLPQSVAEDLKLGLPVKAELFDQVTIYFSDIVGFTKICADSTPIEVVNLLNSLYTLFDDIITNYDVYKLIRKSCTECCEGQIIVRKSCTECCEGQIIVRKSCTECCEGQIIVRKSCTECCEGQIIVRKSCTECCEGQIILRESCTECCAGQIILRKSCTECCEGQIIVRKSCTECCEGQIIVRKSCTECCEGQIIVRESCTECCAGQIILRKSCTECCVGQIILRKSCNECCEGQIIVRKSCAECCEGQIILRKSCAECCEGQIILRKSCNECCEGQIILRKSCAECCEGQIIFRKSCAECCEGQIILRKSCNECCEGQIILLKSCAECCEGQIIVRKSCAECCEGQIILRKSCNECCEGQIILRKSCNECCEGQIILRKSCNECCEGQIILRKSCAECCEGQIIVRKSCAECCEGQIIVETIGDAYMLASGLPKRNGSQHTKEIANAALEILSSISNFTIPHLPDRKLKIRIGIHTGPVVAGVVGLAMPRYCLFGDAVNTASRMESTGVPLRIHISQSAKDNLQTFSGYHIEHRGEIEVKGKGKMLTYFLTGRDGFYKSLPNPEDYEELVPEYLPMSPVEENYCTETLRHQKEANKLTYIEDSTSVNVRVNNGSSFKKCRRIATIENCMKDTTEVQRFDEEDPNLSNGSQVISSPNSEEAGGRDQIKESKTEIYAAVLTGESELVTKTDEFFNESTRSANQKSDINLKSISCDPDISTTLKLTSADNGRQTGPLIKSCLKSSSDESNAHVNITLPKHSVDFTVEDDRRERNKLEYLFGPKSTETNFTKHMNNIESGHTGRTLDISANVFQPIRNGLKVSEDKSLGVKSGDLNRPPKLENTEFRNSPTSSRSSSPKLDFGLLKEQVESRMKKVKEITSL
ncbi:hypothetical protein Btru_006448 [Bulinus truncatus]|nr:hypothetical protein Btru_006448 [Bulinus truncatus]